MQQVPNFNQPRVENSETSGATEINVAEGSDQAQNEASTQGVAVASDTATTQAKTAAPAPRQPVSTQSASQQSASQPPLRSLLDPTSASNPVADRPLEPAISYALPQPFAAALALPDPTEADIIAPKNPAPVSPADEDRGASSPDDNMRFEYNRRERQMVAIQHLSRTLLTRSGSLDDLMKEALSTAINVLDADVGSVQIYNPKTESLIFRHVHDPAEKTLLGMSVPITKGIDGKVFRTGIPDITNSVPESTEWNPDVDTKTGYHTNSMLTVPIKRQEGDTLGVIQILNGRRPFDQRDLEVLEILSAQAAQAMVNAHLFEEAKRRLDHLQALRNIDIAITASMDLQITLDVFVEQVIGQLRLDAVDVLLLNPHLLALEYSAGRGFRSEALRHTKLRLGEGLAGRAALERRIISVPNLSEDRNDLIRSPHLREEGFVTYFAVPLIAKGHVKGVLEAFHRTRLEPDMEWLGFLETLAGQAAIAIDNAEMFDDLQRTNTELALAYDTTIEGWSSALDLRDKETEGHTMRVTELTLRLARAAGLTENELVHVRRGALLHDIGKMGVPDSILLKPGPLSDEEWMLMRQHPMYALNLLSRIPYLRPALDIPYYHHEKWDGTGYPCRLAGEQIPLSARLFAVADVWDALRSDRPYRACWPEDKARQYILSEAGKHFDPQAVEIFCSLDLSHLEKHYNNGCRNH